MAYLLGYLIMGLSLRTLNTVSLELTLDMLVLLISWAFITAILVLLISRPNHCL